MLKSTGIKKTNIAVFISGKGTNFKNLIQYSLKKKSKFKIKLAVSNNSNAKGLEYAKKYKIKKKIINYKNLTNSEIHILNELNKENINIICLAAL
jgi:phosphoribosylglycinamide formyltransferase-1